MIVNTGLALHGGSEVTVTRDIYEYEDLLMRLAKNKKKTEYVKKKV
jgi:hypothetical protein